MKRQKALVESASPITHEFRASPLKMSQNARTKFYASWKNAAVRQAAGIPELTSAIDIAKVLGLSLDETIQILAFLTEQKLVTKTPKSFELGSVATHLPATDPLYKIQHLNWRLRANEEISSQQQQVFFTATMSISKASFENIRRRILELLKEVRTDATHVENPDELAALNIDFFSLLKHPKNQ